MLNFLPSVYVKLRREFTFSLKILKVFFSISSRELILSKYMLKDKIKSQ